MNSIDRNKDQENQDGEENADDRIISQGQLDWISTFFQTFLSPQENQQHELNEIIGGGENPGIEAETINPSDFQIVPSSNRSNHENESFREIDGIEVAGEDIPERSMTNIYYVDQSETHIIEEVEGVIVPFCVLQFCGYQIFQIPARTGKRLLILAIPLFFLLLVTFAFDLFGLFPSEKTPTGSITPSLQPAYQFKETSEKPSVFLPFPSDPRSVNITNAIFEVSGSSLYRQGSPQNSALRWLLEKDTRNLDSNDSNLVQRFSLMVLYFSLNGEDWFVKTGYGSGENECNWYGLTCNTLNKLTELDLSVNNLHGQIPNEIQFFELLRNLNFWNNGHIDGTIPNSITKLRNLREVRLDGNKLEGTIPNELACARLQLGYNGLNGTLPSSFGSYRRWELISLKENQLSGSIPMGLYYSKSLQKLHLEGNNLTGHIPEEVRLTFSLTDYRVDNNLLSGTIPTTFGEVLLLQNLILNQNQIQGTIPSELGLLRDLQNLNLRNNLLNGTVPAEICQLNLKILTVDCSQTSPSPVNCSCCTNSCE